MRYDRDQQLTPTADRLRPDGARAQFVRFAAAGAAANVLYGVLFLLLTPCGSQVANLAGALASSALANELHRRLTFRAGGRVGWLRAQWEGGGLAVAGTVATSVALARFDAVDADAGAATHLAVVAVVTGAVGLLRFAVLRWTFSAGRHGTTTAGADGAQPVGVLTPVAA